jgi:endonuclease YncB( thermonuclease family)
VLIGSLGIYAVERWMRPPGAPIIGSAFVIDGDTLSISGTRIRLIDIDAPELDQMCVDARGRDWACGREASAQLRSHLRGRDLTCQPKSKDQYERVLATCTLPDGSNINAWMVQEGWAVTYSYADTYVRQQADAKSARRGLWSGSFMSPREWRHEHPRSSEGDRFDHQ